MMRIILMIMTIQRGQRTQRKILKGGHLGDLRPSQSLLIARVSLRMIHVTIHMSTSSTQMMSQPISQRILRDPTGDLLAEKNLSQIKTLLMSLKMRKCTQVIQKIAMLQIDPSIQRDPSTQITPSQILKITRGLLVGSLKRSPVILTRQLSLIQKDQMIKISIQSTIHVIRRNLRGQLLIGKSQKNLIQMTIHQNTILILDLMMTLDRLTTLKTIPRFPSPMIQKIQITSTFLSTDLTHTGRNPRTKNP